MSKRYKLVEITHEEHLTLADAGVWVQWDVNFGWAGAGWSSECSVASAGACCRRKPLNPGYSYKFYTRVEVDGD